MGRHIPVLIVDDSASVRQTLSEILSSDPRIEVIGTAADPFAAARRISKEVPDVITLDVSMPLMDGIEFTRQARQLLKGRPVPILILTTESELDKKNQARAAGATGWIVKPFNPERLLATVAKVLT